MSELPEMSAEWEQTLNWQPAPEQLRTFQELYEHVLAGNRQFNLTRIVDPTEFWEKHLWDSLRGTMSVWAEAGLTVIDVGTGAGFPGLPISIAQPDWQVTLLDSTRKKVQFVDTVIEALGLTNAITLVERVETIGHQPQHREAYDLALVRAVAAAPVCAEYALPLLRPGGTAILYRGQWDDTETAALEPAVNQLGGAIGSIDLFKTPLSHSDRTCVCLKKVSPTPAEFPRSVGVPVQKPLA